MKLLTFDTSTTACSVALQNEAVLTIRHQVAPMQHAKLVLPMVDELLKESQLTLKQLDAIAYGCGPGSFTGIRIATSIAQGLGFATQVPLIPLSSLATFAQTAFQEQGWQKLLVALDARMDQVYWAAYIISPEGIATLMDKEFLCKPNEIPLPPDKDWHGIGDAWEKYADVFATQLGFTPPNNSKQLPHASAMIKLAALKYAQNEWVSPADALPVYLRDE